ARVAVAETSAAPLRCFPLPVSVETPPRLLSPPVPFGPRPHVAPPQDPAPAARTARAPVAEISVAPLRCSRLLVSAGTLPRLLSPPVPSGSRPRAAPPQDPAPAARTARADLAEISAPPPPCLRLPVSVGTLPRLLSPPVPFGSRRRAAPPQDPAPAARTARADLAVTSAAPRHCSRLPVSVGMLPLLLSPAPSASLPRAAPPH